MSIHEPSYWIVVDLWPMRVRLAGWPPCLIAGSMTHNPARFRAQEEVRTQTYRVDGAGDSMWTLEGSGSGWGTKPAPTLPANQKVKDTEKMTKGMSEGDGTGARGGSEPVIMREGGAGAGAGGIVGGGARIPLTEGERCLLTFRLEEGPVVTELVRVMTLLDDPTGELVVLEREAPSTDVGDLVVSVSGSLRFKTGGRAAWVWGGR